MDAEPGTATLVYDVTADDLAVALGSGDVEVLATPRLLAWCEAATVAALAGSLGESRTSVGVQVELRHLLATPVGGRVEVRARIESRDERTVSFAVSASDRAGRTVVEGRIVRAVVDRARFLGRVPSA
jgi:fluoroacetyl-CoA thioesterase